MEVKLYFSVFIKRVGVVFGGGKEGAVYGGVFEIRDFSFD